MKFHWLSCEQRPTKNSVKFSLKTVTVKFYAFQEKNRTLRKEKKSWGAFDSAKNHKRQRRKR